MSTVPLGMPSVPGSGVEVPARPARPGLIDKYGRAAHDLRVSLTDRCNLRCTYCMPQDGLDWMPSEQVLTDAEVVRLVRIAVERLEIRHVRFTGGEPLLRKGLERIVEEIASLRPRPKLSLTTNGIGLARRAQALADAGLDRVNVSLDSLRRDRFQAITRRDRLDDVLAGLAAAAAANLRPVKMNAVLIRGVNDDEAPGLLRFALARGYELRFIEQMPLDAQHGWDRTNMVTASEIKTELRTEYRLEPSERSRGSAPAESFLIDGGPASVGIIASVTEPFCGDCDRTRLTADGAMRTCLFSQSETDLRRLVRGGASDEDIADAWRDSMWRKKAGHGIDDPGFVQPDRPMSAIGG